MRLLLIISPYIWKPIGNVLSAMAGTIRGILPAFVIVVMVMLLFLRFYRAVTGSEAYLHFTLPVGVDAHLLARLAVSTVWTFAGFIVVTVMRSYIYTGFLAYNNEFGCGSKQNVCRYSEYNCSIRGGFRSTRPTLRFDNLFSSSLCVISNLLNVYTSVAVGTLVPGHPLLGGIVGYILYEYSGSYATSSANVYTYACGFGRE